MARSRLTFSGGRTGSGSRYSAADFRRHATLNDLFRPQAIDFQRQKFHGAIVLTRSPRRTAWAMAFVLLVGALIVFASTQGFARKESVPGLMMPAGGVRKVVAPAAGVVLADGAALQGQTLAAGDTLLRLSIEQAGASGQTRAAVAQSLSQRRLALQQELLHHAEQTRQRSAELAARAIRLADGLAQQEGEVALQRQRVALSEEVAGRYPQLVASGAVSPVEVAEKTTEVLDQRARLSVLERDRLTLAQDLATVQAQHAALPQQAGREGLRLQREIEALAQEQAENDARRNAAVSVPQAGLLATLLVSPGQSVVAGQALATLVPAGVPLEAELYVPTRSAGFVRPGTPVMLRVDAFPYARFGQLPGRVREVSQSAEPRSGAEPPSAPLYYRVHVELDTRQVSLGQSDPMAWQQALKAGMGVQATLVAERRTLLEWVMEPLAALQAAMR